MGSGVARSLLAAGLPVAVFDVRPEPAAAIAGATVCTSSAAVAGNADVVCIVVYDGGQVREVLFGPDGLLAGADPGLVVIVCTTMSVEDVVDAAATAEAAGVALLDVGISGSPEDAASGQLVVMVGGDDEAVATAAPVLEMMAREVIRAGVRGQGMRLKLIKNAMSYLTMSAVHEAMRLAERVGVPLDAVRQTVVATDLVDDFFWHPLARPSTRPAPDDAARHYAEMCGKDLDAILAMGNVAAVDLPVATVTRRLAERIFLVSE